MSLEKNLDNIETQANLFGEEIPQLSMKDRIGFLPISIWKPDWTIVKELKAVVGDSGESRVDCGENAPAYARGGGGKSYPKVASIYNPHLAQMILSAYCPKNATIYDPYGGGGTRGFIATAMGHNYTGIEIRQNEVDRIKEQQSKLEIHFNIICDNSCTYEIENEKYNFSYTCPPYFNLEIYSELENDTSNADSYENFLKMTKYALATQFYGLKKGSLAVWTVGNFRDKKGNLTHFSGDVVRIGKEVGFQLHDELIFWGASGAAVLRCGNFQANRRSVRVHENIIIFKK